MCAQPLVALQRLLCWRWHKLDDDWDHAEPIWPQRGLGMFRWCALKVTHKWVRPKKSCKPLGVSGQQSIECLERCKQPSWDALDWVANRIRTRAWGLSLSCARSIKSMLIDGARCTYSLCNIETCKSTLPIPPPVSCENTRIEFCPCGSCAIIKDRDTT